LRVDPHRAGVRPGAGGEGAEGPARDGRAGLAGRGAPQRLQLGPPSEGGGAMRGTAMAAAALLALAGTAPAGSSRDLPPGLKGVEIEPLLKEQIPPDLAFRDANGKSVRLGGYFGAAPERREL